MHFSSYMTRLLPETRLQLFADGCLDFKIPTSGVNNMCRWEILNGNTTDVYYTPESEVDSNKIFNHIRCFIELYKNIYIYSCRKHFLVCTITNIYIYIYI